MNTLTDHEKKILDLIKQNPKIISDRSLREKIAKDNNISEKTLRNRIAEFKRFGLIQSDSLEASEKYKNFFILWSRKKLIFINCISVTLISIAISLLMPKWYESKAVILSSSAGKINLASAFSDLPLNQFGFSPVSEDISSFISILVSRNVKEKMVVRFNLIDVYDSRDVEYAIKDFESNMNLKVTDEGALSISIFDKNPALAHKMVAESLVLLDSINRELSREQGLFNRKFLEKRLNENKRDLSMAEEQLKIFQQKTGVVDVLTQVTSQMEAFSQLHSQELQAYTSLYSARAQTKVQLNTLKATLSKDNPSIKHYEVMYDEQNKELDELRSKLDKELEGLLLDSDEKTKNDKVWVSMSSFPDLAMTSARLLREVSVQSKLLEILVPQYEQARMEENKNIPTLQILDEPKIPLNKSKPKRLYIVLGSFFMSIILSFLLIFFEYYSRDLRKTIASFN